MKNKIEKMVREHVAVEIDQGIFRANVDVSEYALTAQDVEYYTDRGFSREEIREIERQVRAELIAIQKGGEQ